MNLRSSEMPLTDMGVLIREYEETDQLQERFSNAMGGFLDSSPDRLELDMSAGWSREGDMLAVEAVIAAVAQNPDRKVRFLEVAAGPTYIPFAGKVNDFGSPWVARRLSASLPVESIAVDRLPDSLLRSTDSWAGFTAFFRAPDGRVIPVNYVSPRQDESDVLLSVVGVPPLSIIQDGRFMPVDPHYLGQLDYAITELGLNGRSPLAYFRSMTEYEPLTEGSCFIRPTVDTEIEAQLFNLAVHGGVDARDPEQLPSDIDIISLRHTGTYFSSRHVESMRSRLRPGGQLVICGDRPQP